MNLTGYVVRVHLSKNGKEEIGSHLGGSEFEALVVGEHSTGLCVSKLDVSGPSRILLLKWEHFATVYFDYEPEAPAERPRAGFHT